MAAALRSFSTGDFATRGAGSLGYEDDCTGAKERKVRGILIWWEGDIFDKNKLGKLLGGRQGKTILSVGISFVQGGLSRGF